MHQSAIDPCAFRRSLGRTLNRVGMAVVRAALATLTMASVSVFAASAGPVALTIPYTKFVLDNGLTLIVHEDHKAPVVAVNVWYHVGSKNEPVGKTGFAHLFEHLMFNGSEHYNDDYFRALERVGATSLNGTTNQDRTNYFQNVPTGALDVALWMESDRMGHLLGAVDEARLTEQRGVVQNEKRQGENRPYGKVFGELLKRAYPGHHPYSWSVIGSMADLDAASLADVHEWFKTYYGAANAVIVLAGDVTPTHARERVEHFFGHIPAGPPLVRQNEWIARRTGSQTVTLYDRVPQTMIMWTWNVPGFGTDDNELLSIAASLMADGKNSRLYKRLVYDDKTATAVTAWANEGEIGGAFFVRAMVASGADPASVRAGIGEELAKLISSGPSKRELERVRMENIGRFVRRAERVGGFGGKSDLLAAGETFLGRPDYYQTRLRRWQSARRRDVQRATRKWLSDGVLQLEVHPYAPSQHAADAVDRSGVPTPAPTAAPGFPGFERATLANGLKVIVASRRDAPLVSLSLLTRGGYGSDLTVEHGTSRLGLARMGLEMLDEGAAGKSALDISAALSRLGATLRTRIDNDQATLSMSALSESLAPSLALFADVIVKPDFPAEELERQRAKRLSSIRQAKSDPRRIARRVMPILLFGMDHPYGVPGLGLGREADVDSLARTDLVRYHRSHFQPGRATLVAVGDTTMAEIRPLLERAFRQWGDGVPAQSDPMVGRAVEATGGRPIYVVDRPDSSQSTIMVGQVMPGTEDDADIAAGLFNQMLGGSFTSRINMNLREDKHWSYGARTRLHDGRGQRMWMVTAPVQADRTAESMVEIRQEIEAFVGAAPATAEELAKVRRNRVLSLPGQWETIGSVATSLARIVRFGLADDYWQRYPSRIASLDLEAVRASAQRYLRPAELVWLVVGDLRKVEGPIKALGWARIQRLDADGMVLDN